MHNLQRYEKRYMQDLYQILQPETKYHSDIIHHFRGIDIIVETIKKNHVCATFFLCQNNKS